MSGPVLHLREADGDQRQPLAIRGSVFVLEGYVSCCGSLDIIRASV